KKVVKFKAQNLLEPFSLPRFHALFICNVLIYMLESAIRIVYNNLSLLTEDDAILLIAPTDPSPKEPWRLLDESRGWPIFSRSTRGSAIPARSKKDRGRGGPRHIRKRPAPLVIAPQIAPPDATNSVEDRALWTSWARGELGQTSDLIRKK